MTVFYRRFGKRAFDIVVASALLGFLLPLLVLLTLAVRIRLGAPVFFSQRRGGHRNTVFNMVKFRSMTTERDRHGVLLPDERRLTTFGKVLRSWSLDELPQLVHVIKGDMSLIGPRPFLDSYLPHYTAEQKRRHDVRPGITGLAQVSGRNALSWEEKFEYDLYYVDHVSFWMDLKILWRTIGVISGRNGVSADGHATMPAWTPGTPQPRQMSRQFHRTSL